MATQTLHRTIREQIANHIRNDVLSGQLDEGDPLREQDLAARYGVSRGPIRDALLQLTQEGLLVSKPNCGVRVAAGPGEDIQPLVVRLRRQIEKFSLRKILKQPDDGLVADLERLVEEMRAACERGDMAEIVEHDMAFHRLLLARTGDEDLIAIWQPIVTRMMLRYSRLDDRMMIYREHEAIVDAIRDGDRAGAIQALEQNIQ